MYVLQVVEWSKQLYLLHSLFLKLAMFAKIRVSSLVIVDSDFSASRAATDKPKETPYAVDNREQGALGQPVIYSTVL